MKVEELMTADVVTVGPDTPIREVAAVLVERGISGIPVVAHGQLLGVVSEADILAKEKGRSPRGGALGRLLTMNGEAIRLKEDARTAFDAMTAPAITIAPRDSVSEAARLMLELRIGRLPVVDDGRLVGIVTRADLMRAFHRTDEQIEHEIRQDVILRMHWISPGQVQLEVRNGCVQMRGVVDNRGLAESVRTFVERVPGVVAVDSRLRWPPE